MPRQLAAPPSSPEWGPWLCCRGPCPPCCLPLTCPRRHCCPAPHHAARDPLTNETASWSPATLLMMLACPQLRACQFVHREKTRRPQHTRQACLQQQRYCKHLHNTAKRIVASRVTQMLRYKVRLGSGMATSVSSVFAGTDKAVKQQSSLAYSLG